MALCERNSLVAFGATTCLALFVFSLTLAPQVTFGHSGIFSAAAMYPGPSVPSGHPIWAIVGWGWIKVFPFGNIAWRLAMGSAMCAAIACGIVAVIVSRIGSLVLEGRENLGGRIAGVVAGLGLAFEQGFWSKAVVVDSWAFTALLFTLIVYGLSRWFFEPKGRRWFYGAAFLSGAGLCESQALAPAIFVLPMVVALVDLKLGRNFFLAESLMLCCWLAAQNGLADVGWQVTAVWHSVETLATATTIAWVICWWRTRRPFGEFRCFLTCVGLFVTGLSLCFLNPVLSMTNPPVNWGYPRTEEGFAHVLSRGQFDSFDPPVSVSQLGVRLGEYGSDLLLNVGPMYLVAAGLTLALGRREPMVVQRWIVGMWVMWIVVTVVSVAALNLEQREISNVRALFTPGVVVLMILAGCGVALVSSPRKDILTERKC
jgi:hypothetical protein